MMNTSWLVPMVRHGGPILLVATLLGALVGLAVTGLTPPRYRSETQVFVTAPPGSTVAPGEVSRRLLLTSAELATSDVVLDAAGRSVRPPLPVGDLAGRVRVDTDPNTLLITVAVLDADPRRAAELAGAVAGELIAVTGGGSADGAGAAGAVGASGDAVATLSVVTPATIATTPVGPGNWLGVGVGLIGGLIVGGSVVVIRWRRCHRLHAVSDLVSLAPTSVLASIPAEPSTDLRSPGSGSGLPLLAELAADTPRGAAYRRLRVDLRFAQIDDARPVVLISSATVGEGRTTTAVNLAIAVAQAGKRVALVDADHHRPGVAGMLGLENSAGLTTALLGDAPVADVLQAWGDDELYVLAAGEAAPNPADLLGSRAMGRLLAELVADFDLVVLDAPPVTGSGALELTQHVDRTLLVAAVGWVRMHDLRQAWRRLTDAEVERVNIVPNLVPDGAAAPAAARPVDGAVVGRARRALARTRRVSA